MRSFNGRGRRLMMRRPRLLPGLGSPGRRPRGTGRKACRHRRRARLHACTLNGYRWWPGRTRLPPGISFSSAGGVNTVTRAGLAQALVRFPWWG
jgi:hypothetical protein